MTLFLVDIDQMDVRLPIILGMLSWIWIGVMAFKMYPLALRMKTGGEMQYLAAVGCWFVFGIRPLIFCGEMSSWPGRGRGGGMILASAVFNAFAAILATVAYFGVKRTVQEYEQQGIRQQEAATEAARLEFVAERKALEQRFQLFSESDEYQYVRQFAKKYGRRFEREHLKKLRQLISVSWDFRTGDLKELLDAELYAIDLERLTSRLDSSGDESRDGIARAFLSYYSAADSSSLDLLYAYFTRKGRAGEDLESTLDLVKRVAAEMEAERFREQLLDESSVHCSDLEMLSGYEFEAFLKDLFLKMGYEVEQTRLSGDQGADLVVVKLGERTVVQAKRFMAKVGNKAVQEIVAAMSLYQANAGMVITNSRFTPAAYELAQANEIHLIDGEALAELIRNYW